MEITLKQIIYDYAKSLLGLPYIYGGNTPLIGLDCSGLVQEILSSVGVQPPTDMNAQSLYEYYKKNGSENISGFGALVFFGASKTEISHIGFCLDSLRMIEARGGDHTTVSRDIAAKKNACVSIRPIAHRKDVVAYVMPNYPMPLV